MAGERVDATMLHDITPETSLEIKREAESKFKLWLTCNWQL